MANNKILLIEPGYKNKYPPLGLMKLAQYHGPRGKRDEVVFVKGEDKSVLGKAWDRIYVTTLFSFEYQRISETIDFALRVAGGNRDKVFVGGIAASLMHDRFLDERRWSGVRIIKGLLTSPPASSLQLDSYSDELYSDDLSGTPIEDLIPDYSILDQIEYKYPVNDAYFTYGSRGCIRKCSFCGVPKLEGDQRDTESVTAIVRGVEELYGAKKDLTLMDNNVVASAKFKEIIAEIRDLGFTPGAKLKRGRGYVQRRVDFNQGVDARILCKDKMYLRELSTICLKPLRIAFDHIGLKAPYEQAIRYANEFGLTELSNYMLYNFHDSPDDLFERMRLNVQLNEELGIRIWSFPMRFQPTDRPNRSFIGEKWTRYQLRSMQLVLQATHGVVSGNPSFFKRAFGDSYEDFERILLMPYHFIFNRDWYEHMDGKPEFDQFSRDFTALSVIEKTELLQLLSSTDVRWFERLPQEATTSKVKRILQYYVPLDKTAESLIWKAPRGAAVIADDERVEDAGLNDDLDSDALVATSNMTEITV
ncbi:MAG: radical SAM protein [Candidatus Pacebacteria bacterium]|nr:radical SAM protein [Candidatus Paceibacterota bacterium]